MAAQDITVKPISGSLGAEVQGVDLSRPLDNATFAAVHQAFLDHKAIFFRDQTLTPEQHKAFSFRFGTAAPVKFVKTLDGHPEIIEIVREPQDAGQTNFGGRWHSDFSFYEKPPLGSCLYMLETPPHGGDTLWVDMEKAYAALSDGLKAMLDGMTALHSGERSYGTRGRFAKDKLAGMQVNPDAEGDIQIEHPVVRTHPETGRKGLFINPVYTIRFRDMTEEESKPILDMLFAHALRPEFQCRFDWSPGALALWDNRCTMHLAINDYDGHRRVTHRTTIAGDRPF